MMTRLLSLIASYLYTFILCGKVEKYMCKNKCDLETALQETAKQEMLIRKMTDKKFIYRYVDEQEAQEAFNRLKKYSKGNV